MRKHKWFDVTVKRNGLDWALCVCDNCGIIVSPQSQYLPCPSWSTQSEGEDAEPCKEQYLRQIYASIERLNKCVNNYGERNGAAHLLEALGILKMLIQKHEGHSLGVNRINQ